MKIIFKFSFNLFLILSFNHSIAQNISTTIGSVNLSNCHVGDTVSVPVSISMNNNISTSGISLAIDYDATKLECIGSVTSVNPVLNSSLVSNCGIFSNLNPNFPYNASTRFQFRAVWFNLSPVTFNGLVFNLNFIILSTGNSTLRWDLSNNGNCEYVDEFADVISNCSFVDGGIICGDTSANNCGITLISDTNSTNQNVCQNSILSNISYNIYSTMSVAVVGLPPGVTSSLVGNLLTISGSPTIAGVFTYTVTLTGCTGGISTANGVINVSAPISAGTVSGMNVICQGQSVHFTTSTPNGLWSSSNTNIATVNSSTGLVTGISFGNATITYTIPGPGGCQNVTASKEVTIYQNNSITLTSLQNTDKQVVTLGDSIINITYSAFGIGAAITGLPPGIIATVTNAPGSFFLSKVITIGGVSSISGTFQFTILLTGGCTHGNNSISGSITVNPYPSYTMSQLCLPAITTTSPSSVGADSVVIGGNITNDGGSSIVLRGVCYSNSPNPNMGNSRTQDGLGIGSFNTVLRGLTPSMTYYARSYAKNSNGVVVYGNNVSFTTFSSFVCGTSTVSDVDNNMYNTAQIGTQCWTQSNLKVSKYRNGDNIPTGLSNSAWQNTTSGAYAIYNNDPVADSLYGKLYNHYAVTDSRGLCPTGWHVPSDREWKVLTKYLDPSADTNSTSYTASTTAGGVLKSTATQPTPGGWNSPNTGATNTSGFTALPGGFRHSGGDFFNMQSIGFWWSSSFFSGSEAWMRYLYANYSDLVRNPFNRKNGFSVRCLKD